MAEIKSNLVSPEGYEEYPQISPDNIEKNAGKLLAYNSVEEAGIISGNHLFYKGQILYSKIRPNLNKVIIAPFDGLCSADMYPIESNQMTKFTTIQLFGHQNTKGQKEAFHVYSMKQAIEEGFILDVLQNYTEYSTFYQINKEIEDDPRCKTNDAKRQIARFIELHDTNIAQRVEVIVEHFRTTVMQELGGQAKAMVITA